MADGAPEAVDVVVELESFDYHGSASTSCARGREAALELEEITNLKKTSTAIANLE